MQAGSQDREPVHFGSPPLRLADIVGVGPYGIIAGAHVIPTDHQGYMFPEMGTTPRYDVLAVGDGEIVQVTVRTVSVDTGRPSSPQYHVTLRHSCSIITQYDLIDELAPPWGLVRGEHQRVCRPLPGPFLGHPPGGGLQRYELMYYDYEDAVSGVKWDYQAPVHQLRGVPFGEVRGTLLMQLIADRRLKVEVFPGKRADAVSGFTAAAVIYER